MKPSRRFADEASEAGETLIEVLLASALMAVLVVAVIGGMATMLMSSTLHRSQANGNVALVGAMEKVKSTDVSRQCATVNTSHPYYAAAGLSVTGPVTIQQIEYETIQPDGSGNPSVVWSSNLSDCSLASAYTLQRITLKYTSTDNRVTPTLSFVKGDY